ncbi:hypothetical protein T439DRAFT_99698 [Meredithblackwellia eburnea MCA 4105]
MTPPTRHPRQASSDIKHCNHWSHNLCQSQSATIPLSWKQWHRFNATRKRDFSSRRSRREPWQPAGRVSPSPTPVLCSSMLGSSTAQSSLSRHRPQPRNKGRKSAEAFAKGEEILHKLLERCKTEDVPPIDFQQSTFDFNAAMPSSTRIDRARPMQKR